MNFLKKGRERYSTVSNSEDGATTTHTPFAIDDNEDEVEMSMDALARIHEDLLKDAKSAISSTEDSVRWLNEERATTEHNVRALTEDGVGHDMRPKPLCKCCPGRAGCAIL